MIVNTFVCEWKNQLQLTTGKKGGYNKRKLKIHFVMHENYLEIPFYLRNPLTKLRISNHQLQIETG